MIKLRASHRSLQRSRADQNVTVTHVTVANVTMTHVTVIYVTVTNSPPLGAVYTTKEDTATRLETDV